MAITEVFPNPTVKTVIFQIRFPNVFSMESLVGDYQQTIMERFPESRLLLSKQFIVLAEEEKRRGLPPDHVAKIWNFRADRGIELNVKTDSLDITSTSHKTYNNQNVEHRFRDVIEYAVNRFIDVTKIGLLSRIGLRYIDEVPITASTNTALRAFCNTTLPLGRFNLKDASELTFGASVKRKKYYLNFRENLKREDRKSKLTLDFDGYALRVESKKFLDIADALHGLISEEYEASITERLRKYMRKK